MKGLRYHWN